MKFFDTIDKEQAAIANRVAAKLTGVFVVGTTVRVGEEAKGFVGWIGVVVKTNDTFSDIAFGELSDGESLMFHNSHLTVVEPA
jgi:hypothetical protein